MTSRFTFDSTRSYLQISGRSSLHPIDTETRGITGWIEVAPSDDGAIDVTAPVAGELELAVDRLTSGNHLYDRELRRRINARRYPTIGARLVRCDTVCRAPDVPRHRRRDLPRAHADVRTRHGDPFRP